MDKCEDCNAFQRVNPKNGVCRANPPSLLVFGMEQVNVPGLNRGAKGMRPLTGTGYPETPNDQWCRQFERAPAKPTVQPAPKFDPSQLKPAGEVQSLNGQDVTEGANSNELQN